MATTEVHKLPETILSRCQRSDFNRIQPEGIAGRLNYVAHREGATLENEAAILKPNMNIGSKIIFNTAPIKTVNILVRANP